MVPLKTTLINTGSELLIGRVLNTHQQWLGRQLTDLGYQTVQQITVEDSGEAIRDALITGFKNGPLVVITGGLGPTSDDMTRPILADFLNMPLVRDEVTASKIQAFFASRNRPMSEDVLVQAMIPQGAVILPNDNGTAPGLWIKATLPGASHSGGYLLMLPGPPRELHPMFSTYAVPLLLRDAPSQCARVYKTLRTTGIGESRAACLIEQGLAKAVSEGLQIGYCARPGEVDIRLSTPKSDNLSLLEGAVSLVRTRLKQWVFTEDDADTLEAVVLRLLKEEKRTLSLAESCTGGHIANLITHVPGASAVLKGGIVAYANEVKTDILGVDAGVLERCGAVSEEVAIQMAQGVRRVLKTDYSLAVTGIAGPDGGSLEKPVGTVCIALAHSQGCKVVTYHNPVDRVSFKHLTAQQALDLLRRAVAC